MMRSTRITFEGKTGIRRCPYTNNSLCFPYIRDWLNVYKPKNSDSPLFVIKTGEPYDYKNLRRLMQHIKEWTGIKKRLNAHSWRFATATILGGQLTETDLKHFMGWSLRSQQTATYVKRNDKLLAESIKHITGKPTDEPEEKPKPQTRKCQKCDRIRPITEKYCACGSRLDGEQILRETMEVMNQQKEVQNLQKEVKGL